MKIYLPVFHFHKGCRSTLPWKLHCAVYMASSEVAGVVRVLAYVKGSLAGFPPRGCCCSYCLFPWHACCYATGCSWWSCRFARTYSWDVGTSFWNTILFGRFTYTFYPILDTRCIFFMPILFISQPISPSLQYVLYWCPKRIFFYRNSCLCQTKLETQNGDENDDLVLSWNWMGAYFRLTV